MLNDYTFLDDPTKATDSRWVHRSRRKWEAGDDLTDADTLQWRFFNEMVRLISIRKQLPAFYNGGMRVIDSGNPHIFAFIRENNGQRVMVINNFSEQSQSMPLEHARRAGLDHKFIDLISGDPLLSEDKLMLKGYRYAWLAAP